jgi:hypothetical protein
MCVIVANIMERCSLFLPPRGGGAGPMALMMMMRMRMRRMRRRRA